LEYRTLNQHVILALQGHVLVWWFGDINVGN